MHPRIRIPLWVAVAVVAVAYVGRSVLRGFDFRPDLPVDAIVLALFALMLALVAYVRRWATKGGEDDERGSRQEEDDTRVC